MKEDQNGKKTKMEVKKNYVRVFSKDKGASYLRFARFFPFESSHIEYIYYVVLLSSKAI